MRFTKIFLLVSLFCLISSVANASIPTWRILWIILPRINAAHTDGVTYNFTLTQDEITKIREISERVEQFIEESTGNAVDIEMTVIESKGTVRSLTDDGTYLCVAEDDFPSDVKRELEHAKEEDNPYQIKVATFRLDGDSEKLYNWYGLGGGTYARVHFYNNTKSSDFEVTETAPHPEELWVHELIHCFESIFDDLGTMAGLHDHAKYGYEHINGWYRWYHDILAGQVKDPNTGEYVGIKSNMWQHIPSVRTVYWKGHTYKILDTVRSWSGAKIYCESLGGHLATITSEEEQNIVANLLKWVATWNYFGYWIGGQKDTQWHWVTGEAFNYTKFSAGQPDGSGNYLQMYNYPDPGYWDDTIANANVEIQGGLYPHGILCEWEYITKPSFSILTANHLAGGIVGVSYNQSFTANEKAATWSKISGTLPEGLLLNSAGILSGVPTEVGSFDFTIKAENSGSEYDLKTFTLEVTSASIAPIITTVELKDVNVGDEYFQNLEMKGSSATWKILDKYLPANLILSSNGEITGKASNEGTYEFTVRAENSVGYNDKKFRINVVNDIFPETKMEQDVEQEENPQSEEQNQSEEQKQPEDNQEKQTENNSHKQNTQDKWIENNEQPEEQTNAPREQSTPNASSNNPSGGGGCHTSNFEFFGFLVLLVILK